MDNMLLAFVIFLQVVLVASTVVIMLFSRGCAATFTLFDNKQLLQYLPMSITEQSTAKEILATERAYIAYAWLPLALLSMCNVALYAMVVSHVDNPINAMVIFASFMSAAVIVKASSCNFTMLGAITIAFVEATFRKGVAEIREHMKEIPQMAIDLKCTEEELQKQAQSIIDDLEEKIAEIQMIRRM